MDNLERFITENRHNFDRLHPPGRLWNRIRKASGTGNNYRTYGFTAAALIATTIILAGVLGIIIRSSDFRGRKAAALFAGEAVFYYQSQFNNLYNQAKPFLNSQPELERELGYDIQKLDSILSEIRKDLKDNVANAEVVEAMIRNYRTRVLILEEMLRIIKEKQNEEKIPENL